MRCKTVQTKIDDHADGLLPSAEAEAVRDHLDACPACRDLAFAAKAASTSLAQWGDLPAPEGGFEKLLARIDTLPPEVLAPRRKPVVLRRFAWPAGIAAAAAIAFVVFLAPPFGERSGNGAAQATGTVIAQGAGTGGSGAGALAARMPSPTAGDAASDELRPGEVYVHRDPDDPRLRRVRSGRPALPGGTPANDPRGTPEPVPVKYPSPLGPTYR